MKPPTQGAREAERRRAAGTAAPEQMVSIGSWTLLIELRRLFVRELAHHLRPKEKHVWAENLGQLIEKSVVEWQRIYKDPRLEEDQDQLDALIEHLVDVRERLSGAKPGTMLENLILPYLMTYDPYRTYLRWWFPDDEYLDIYYGSFEADPASVATEPRLYPFISRNVLESLRDSKGVTQLLEEEAPLTERLASGMRSFQTKLIGCFADMYNPYSWREDQLVGNGSGYMHALRSDSGTRLGVLFFCTPVFGLFQEILFNDYWKPEDRRANWICPRHPRDDHLLLGESRRGTTRTEGTGAVGDTPPKRFSFQHPGEGNKSTEILVCQRDYSAGDCRHCLFDAVERRVAPPARSFLAGLQAMVSRADLDRARRLLRKVTHTLSGPLIAARDRYDRMLTNLPVGMSQEGLAEIHHLGTTAVVVSHLCDLNRSWLRRIDRTERGERHDSRRQVTSAATDLEDLIDVMKCLDFFRGLTGASTRIKWYQPRKEPRRVKGSRGTWISIFYTLLANAARATEAAGGGEIQVRRAYDDDYYEGDTGRWLRLDISNPSPHRSEERLREMRACLAGDSDGMDPDPEDPDSMGVGLAIVGQLLRNLEAETLIDQIDGRVNIQIRSQTR